MAELRLVFLTDAAARLVERGWLARAEGVRRQLRPQLGDYAPTMARVFRRRRPEGRGEGLVITSFNFKKSLS